MYLSFTQFFSLMCVLLAYHVVVNTYRYFYYQQVKRTEPERYSAENMRGNFWMLVVIIAVFLVFMTGFTWLTSTSQPSLNALIPIFGAVVTVVGNLMNRHVIIPRRKIST